MKVKNVSSRLKNRATNAACFGFGSAGLMHAAGMLLLLLTLCGCLACLGIAIDNTSPMHWTVESSAYQTILPAQEMPLSAV